MDNNGTQQEHHPDVQPQAELLVLRERLAQLSADADVEKEKAARNMRTSGRPPTRMQRRERVDSEVVVYQRTLDDLHSKRELRKKLPARHRRGGLCVLVFVERRATAACSN